METFCYHPFYCEENIWHLSRDPSLKAAEKYVVFISNEDKTCAMWHMKAAVGDELPVIWDYHVILAAKDRVWQIFDLDSKLGCPVAPEPYLRESFQSGWASSFAPKFRVIETELFHKHFSSDRSHMIHEGHQTPYEPPPWPRIFNGKVSNLWQFANMTEPFLGRVLDLDEFRLFLDL